MNGDHRESSSAEIARERRVRDLFLQALELPDADRDPFLATADAAEDVVDHVRRLLAQHETGSDDAAASLAEVPESLGPYRLVDRIGQGSSATVFLARREGSSDLVALKVLNAEFGDGELARRFQREIRVLARLDHPGIARLIDAGSAETLVGPRRFLAMEFIDGPTLREFMRGESLDPDDALAMIDRLAEAVEHAHSAGVVHRDLKPENVKIGRDDRPVILDFGISRLIGPRDPAATLATRRGEVIGTVGYMSPEQLGGEEVGPPSDIYALGVVAYEMLTGELPFEVPDASLYSSVVAVATRLPRPLPGDLSRRRNGLQTLLDNCLARDPGHRYPDAASLRADLARVAHGQRIVARDCSPGRRGARHGRRRFLAAIVAIGTALAIAATAGLLVSRDRRLSPRILGELTAASQLAVNRLHLEERTEDGVNEAIAALVTARNRVAGATGAGGTVRWLLSYRIAEAYLILGILTEDVATYRKAAQWYDDTFQFQVSAADLDALPDDWPIVQHFMDMSLHLPLVGSAAARAAIAEIEDAETNLRYAVLQAARARDMVTQNPAKAFPQRVQDRPRRQHVAIAHNDLARYLADQAAARRDEGLVERSLGWFAELETMPILADRNPGAHASRLLGHARAHLLRFEFAGRPADLDAAAALLDRVWPITGSPQRGTIYVETVIARARLARARASLATREEQLELVSAAAVALAEVLEAAPAGSRLLPRIGLTQELATVHLARAEVSGEIDAARDALAVVDQGLAIAGQARLPRHRGDLRLLRARALSLLAGLGEEPGLHDTALAELEACRQLAPVVKRPAFDSAIAELERKLRR